MIQFMTGCFVGACTAFIAFGLCAAAARHSQPEPATCGTPVEAALQSQPPEPIEVSPRAMDKVRGRGAFMGTLYWNGIEWSPKRH